MRGVIRSSPDDVVVAVRVLLVVNVDKTFPLGVEIYEVSSERLEELRVLFLTRDQLHERVLDVLPQENEAEVVPHIILIWSVVVRERLPFAYSKLSQAKSEVVSSKNVVIFRIIDQGDSIIQISEAHVNAQVSAHLEELLGFFVVMKIKEWLPPSNG